MTDTQENSNSRYSPGGGYADQAFVAELYDLMPDHSLSVKGEDVPMYVDYADQAGGQVLELACGTGRVLLPIARRGHAVTGLDFSRYMLDALRRKLDAAPPEVRSRVRVVQGDMRRFDLGRRFDLIIIAFRSFQHLLTVGDQIACLRCAHRHLTDGGRLIVNVFNPWIEMLADEECLEEFGDEEEFEVSDGRRIQRRFRHTDRDRTHQVYGAEAIYYVTHPDGRRERLVHAFPFRYIFRYELEHLLVRCGFEIEDMFAWFDKSPLGSRYPGELIPVARRAPSP